MSKELLAQLRQELEAERRARWAAERRAQDAEHLAERLRLRLQDLEAERYERASREDMDAVRRALCTSRGAAVWQDVSPTA